MKSFPGATIAHLAIFSILSETESARILAVFPHIGKSHYFMFEPFVFKLAEKGHDLTIITHFPVNSHPPNVKFVSVAEPGEKLFLNALPLDMLENEWLSPPLSNFKLLEDLVEGACRNLGHPNVQKLLKSDQKFDLLLLEFFNTDCWASLAHVYKMPIIGVYSSTMLPWHNARFGNPDNPAYIPYACFVHNSRMTFLQRTVNAVVSLIYKIGYRFYFDPPSDAAVAKFIGPNIPPVREIVKNSSLFLVNSHFSLFQPRPFVPAIVELGGLHAGPPLGKIPADLLKFIEESPHGVVFFSLGSTVRGSTMSKTKLKVFQEAFSRLQERVLWKWEEDTMVGQPDNVLISKWLPQNDVLAHPKVKLFVTHCGLMGTEEAVYHAVPMLMLPLFGDQPVNAALSAEKGVGVVLDYYTLSVGDLTKGLETVLNDKRFAKNSKRLSKIFKDRPLGIMETAVYWTEYVIRHGGAPHLKSAAVDLAWYQESLLDVAAFLLAVLTFVLYLLRIVVSVLCNKTKKIKGKKKNN